MCFATTCVHVYSISPHDPLEFEIDVIDLIISILSFFPSSPFSHIFPLKKKLFWLMQKRGNDCLQISTILLYLCHFWCITILSISKIKWNMYRFTNLFEFARAMPTKWTRLWHSHHGMFALLFHLLHFSFAAMNSVIEQPILTRAHTQREKHVFLRKFMSAKNHLY